jgi:hypothetical protein
MTRGRNAEKQVIAHESYRRFHNKENNTPPQACYDSASEVLTIAKCKGQVSCVRPGDAFGE